MQRYLPNPLLVKASGGERTVETPFALWRKGVVCVFQLIPIGSM